jgi:hypothetical protein
MAEITIKSPPINPGCPRNIRGAADLKHCGVDSVTNKLQIARRESCID